MEILGMILAGVLINNFVFMQYLGLCPFLGVSKASIWLQACQER